MIRSVLQMILFFHQNACMELTTCESMFIIVYTVYAISWLTHHRAASTPQNLPIFVSCPQQHLAWGSNIRVTIWLDTRKIRVDFVFNYYCVYPSESLSTRQIIMYIKLEKKKDVSDLIIWNTKLFLLYLLWIPPPPLLERERERESTERERESVVNNLTKSTLFDDAYLISYHRLAWVGMCTSICLSD